MLVFLLYMAAGVFVGLASGLFGIGGGTIAVPAMLPIFAAQGIDADVAMHLAVASSMTTIVVTGLSSARAHWRLGNILWDALPWLVGGLALGALLGTQVVASLGGDALRMIFALFVLVLAVRMFIAAQPRPARLILPRVVVAATGIVIGAISALVGIGGGAMMVPFLAWTGVQMREAVGTSAAAGVCLALAGTIGFFYAGAGEEQLPPMSTGYIYWPAVIGITIASVFTAPLGAKLASRLPQVWLRRAFAVFLVAVGLRLMFS